MRSRRSLILVGIIAAATFGFVLHSCSEEDETPTNITVIDDSQTLQEMLGPVAAQVNAHLDSVVATIESGLSVAVYIGTGGATDIGDIFMGSYPPDSTHEIQNWIVSWATDLQAGLGALTVVDSLTYVLDGQITADPADAEEMYFKHQLTFASLDTTVSFADFGLHGNMHVTDIQTDTATINGTFQAELHDKFVSSESTVWHDWSMQTTLADLRVVGTGTSFDHGCPAGGSATVMLQYRYAKDDHVPVITAWQFDVTFDDGTIDVDVTTGNLAAAYRHQLCQP